jgi:hypothetical protein
MLEEALWSPARRKSFSGKHHQENRKAAHWAALFKEAKGEGKNLSGKAMQGVALTHARTDRLKKSTSLEEG